MRDCGRQRVRVHEQMSVQDPARDECVRAQLVHGVCFQEQKDEAEVLTLWVMTPLGGRTAFSQGSPETIRKQIFILQ